MRMVPIKPTTRNHRHGGLRKLFLDLKNQAYLQLFAVAGLAFMLVFSYIPMTGVIIAFKDYKATGGILGFFTSPWVGLKYYEEFFKDKAFWDLVKNTLTISLLKMAFTFPMPILFAIALNEMRGQRIKRIVQTVSYLPHFISWVVVYGIVFSFLNTQTGLANQLLLALGLVKEPVQFLASPQWFYTLAVVTDVWKGMGWWAIIFLAAISGISPELYEAAIVDGAGRLKRIWHITLPGIKGTVVVVLIMSIGNLLGGGLGGSNFEQSYFFGNAANYQRSEILQTYTLKMGLAQGRFSYASAIGLLQSFISLALILGSNRLAKKISGTGLF